MKQLTSYNRVAGYLNKVFDLLNAEFFESELSRPTITIQSTPKAYGHFSLREDTWVSKVGGTHEINIGAGTLSRPIEEVASTLLHEMVHYYNHVKGIQDCSRGNTYHNRKFRDAAEAHGLIVDHHDKYGWTITSPSDELLEVILKYDLTDILLNRNEFTGFQITGTGSHSGTGFVGIPPKKSSSRNTAIMDGKYKDAVSLIETDVVQAYDSLIALDGYKESAEKAAEIYSAYKNAKLLQANVGDYVLFGTYEQDNDTSNGSEAVEWLVLDKDGNRLLVISKYVLDSQPYHTSNDDVTWKTCSLRKWLNQDFMDAAFSADEKAMIPTVSVDSTDSYGKHCSGTTNDQVFVLSIDEAKQYFANIAARKCKFTAYAGSSGDCYWLRTSTTSYSNQFSVRVETGIDDGSTTRGFVDYFFGVRPAIWIDLGTGE